MNRVDIIGRLVRDPELRHAQSGMEILSGTVAVNERVKSGEEWVDKATFVDFTVFGKRASAYHRFHKRGSMTALEGKLRMDEWEDKKTGQKRSKLYVVADQWHFVGGGKDGATQTQSQSPQAEADPWSATPDPAGSFDESPF